MRVAVATAVASVLCAAAQEQSPNVRFDSEPEPAHNIILRVVRVTPDWHSFVHNGGGWSSAVPVKESDHLKYFEATIWEENGAIHLYEFDNSFEQHLGRLGWTPEQWSDHRESYRVMQVSGMPEAYTAERSLFILEAFKGFVSYIVARYPDSSHHLMYSGHGGPGGRLFAALLYYRDAGELLSYWTAALGRALGVVDMGGPCTKGSFSDLKNFCEYARYYIASDIPNGGYTLDDWTKEKWDETVYALQYHRLFAENLVTQKEVVEALPSVVGQLTTLLSGRQLPLPETSRSKLQTVLERRVDLMRKRYEYSRRNMTESGKMQANYLYSCREFGSFSERFLAFLRGTQASYTPADDLLQFLREQGAGDVLIEAFEHVIAHRADNKDFFAWTEERNGMLMPVNEY